MDKVRPLKIENPATGGTETNPFPTELDPLEDYVSSKGLSFEDSDTTFIDSTSGNVRIGSGSAVFTFPGTNGIVQDVLSNDGSGSLSWKAPVAQYQYAESLGISSTTATTFQTKVTLTTPSIPAGTYRIGWVYAVSHSTANRRSEQRITIDGTQVYIVDPELSRTGDNWPGSGFHQVVFASTASHTIQLEYRRQSVTSFTVSIKEGRLEIWRVI